MTTSNVSTHDLWMQYREICTRLAKEAHTPKQNKKADELIQRFYLEHNLANFTLEDIQGE